MFCDFCGAQLPEGSAFCPECGARLAPLADTPPMDDNDDYLILEWMYYTPSRAPEELPSTPDEL